MKTKRFILSAKQTAAADPSLDAEMFAKLWKSFCYTVSELTLSAGGENTFVLGECVPLALDEGDEYTVRITETGAAVLGRGSSCLARGVIELMTQVLMEDEGECFLPVREIRGHFTVARRMIHFCVFPETTLENLHRSVRLAGALQYTHVCIEFWGMLKLETMKCLSWPQAYTKEQVRPILAEARAMGMEIIPMFNQFGHASASRMSSGKHVILDQDPSKQYLFTPEGWSWNIRSEKAFALLTGIRRELYDLCGEGEFFCAGCDEAFDYERGGASKEEIGAYLAKLSRAITEEGRRPVMWGDMLLSAKDCAGGENYIYNEKDADTAKMLRAMLPKETVVADWQYSIKESPDGMCASSVTLHDEGFDVLACPWFDYRNIRLLAATAEKAPLFGAMLTTWHYLHSNLPSLIVFARACGLPDVPEDRATTAHSECAALVRRTAPEGRTYDEYGFTEKQVTPVLG